MPEEFKAINTPEELEAALNERLEEERNKFKDYLSPEDVTARTNDLSERISELEKELATSAQKAKDSELAALKMKVAGAKGLAFELSERLRGSTEEELAADADTLLKLSVRPRETPKFTSEKPAQNTRDAALMEILNKLNNQ